MPFKELQLQNAGVDPQLVLWADQLSGHEVPVPEPESGFGPETRATSGVMHVLFKYSSSSYTGPTPDDEVVVTGLHPRTIIRAIQSALKQMNVKSCIVPEHIPFYGICFSIPLTEVYDSPEGFLKQLVFFTEEILYHQNFVIHIQYEYRLYGESYGTPEGGGTGGSSGSGGTGSAKTGPSGTLSKAIFNSNSRLTDLQWKKVEKALEKINQDCLGGRLIGEVTKSGIKIAHCDTMKANGTYRHGEKLLRIRNFKESDMNDRALERTLLHELIHSRQSGDKNSVLNQEIEVRIATYRYCIKYGVSLGNKYNQSLGLFQYAIDENYNITDQALYDVTYDKYIKELKAEGEYANYPESPSARNMDTIKRLAKDC